VGTGAVATPSGATAPAAVADPPGPSNRTVKGSPMPCPARVSVASAAMTGSSAVRTGVMPASHGVTRKGSGSLSRPATATRTPA
jgi:hypothetical protein